MERLPCVPHKTVTRLSTCSKKDLSLLKENGIFSFAGTVPFLCACVAFLPVRGFWEFLHFLYLSLIWFSFFIGLQVNAHKTEYMCFNQAGDIRGTSLKLVDKFTYLGSSVSSTEKDIDTRLTKAWTAIDKLSIIWKSNLTDKMKRSFFQATVVSILLYGCTTWTLIKRLEKKLDSNYTRCCEQYWISPGGNTPQDTNYTATCLPSRKLSKLDEPDTQNTAGEAETSS